MNRQLRIKVCGMKYTENREAVEGMDVDFLGYIFYSPSKRFVGDKPETGLFHSSKPKVAVFVDENVFEILGLAKNLGFEYVQLHGKENPKTCQILKQQGLKVIKAFSVDENFDFSKTEAYARASQFFLFDTKSNLPGGSGKKFDWKILDKYNGHTPFFISGGIDENDVQQIKSVDHPKLTGVDLNSGFEEKPGYKDQEKLMKFISELRKESESSIK